MFDFFKFFKRKMEPIKERKLVEWKGKGKLSAKGFEVESTFTLEFYIGKQGLLFFELDLFSKSRQEIRNKNIEEFSFSGEFDNGVRVTIDRLILIYQGSIRNGVQDPLKLKLFSEISINRNDFQSTHNERILYRLSNLVFTGSERTFQPHGGWSLDHFSLNLEGFPLEVRKARNYKEIENSLKKGTAQSAETARIVVLAKHKDHEKVTRVVNDLCWLMSFANGNTIVPFAEIHLADKKVIHETYRSLRCEPFISGKHVIPDLPVVLLPNFLQETFENYVKYKKDLGLDVILNYYELMRRNPIMDARCVLGYVLLETLSNNAQEYFEKQKKPILNSLMKSKFKKMKSILPSHEVITDEVLEKLKSEFIYPYPTLQDSINRLMEEFGMKYEEGESKIFSLRKDFIHKGKFQDGVPPVETYNRLVHFIDRLILHILGYTGEYLDVTDAFKHKKVEYKK